MLGKTRGRALKWGANLAENWHQEVKKSTTEHSLLLAFRNSIRSWVTWKHRIRLWSLNSVSHGYLQLGCIPITTGLKVKTDFQEWIPATVEAYLWNVEDLHREVFNSSNVPLVAVDFVGLGGLCSVELLGWCGVRMNYVKSNLEAN